MWISKQEIQLMKLEAASLREQRDLYWDHAAGWRDRARIAEAKVTALEKEKRKP